ncbi:MAG TPA: ABC transporter permease [Candidatus Aenigmarchaeota archaeon]|nr:ABC transporter permease [Candidatus Aenigmarchaeota archaeon]
MLLEYLSIVIRNLSQRKLRSFLTLLGMMIGVAAVVGLVGATQGITQSIYAQLRYFRSDWIIIMPGELKLGFKQSLPYQIPLLTDRDTDVVSKVAGVEAAMGIVEKTLPVEYGGEILYLQVWGIEPEKFKIIDPLGTEEGRYISSNDKFSTLLGNSVAHQIFEEEIGIKKKIKIRGYDFKVVGIRNEYGGLLSNLEDTVVFIPIDTMRELFVRDKERVSLIVAKIAEGADPKKVEDNIKLALCKARKTCGKEDFTLITPSFVEKTVSQIMGLLTILLGGIAGISLLVSGIGIANTMYTSVLERTREIGILKAIGASSRTIMLLFLLEAGIMGLIGGILGCILGAGIGEAFLVARRGMLARTEMSELTRPTPITHVHLTPQLIIGALVFSFFIGILSGLFPARKAAKMDPVEALRYE